MRQLRVEQRNHVTPCTKLQRRIADIGRLDVAFLYPNGLVLRPHVFRSLIDDGAHHWVTRRQIQDAAGVLSSASGIVVAGNHW